MTKPHEPPLATGYHYLYLRCLNCKTPKRLVVPAYPHPKGTILTSLGFGPDACCIRCGAERLAVENDPPTPKPADPPVGWQRPPPEE